MSARARHDGRRMSNGWPPPTFVYVDDEGDFSVEWCVGGQGAPDSWRVSFFLCADGTSCAVMTTHDGQTSEDDPARIGAFLAAALGDA